MTISIFCESSELSASRIAFLLDLSSSPISDSSRFLRFLNWAEASLSKTKDRNSRNYYVSGILVSYIMSEKEIFTNQKFDRLDREIIYHFYKIYDFRIQSKEIFELKLKYINFRSKSYNKNDNYLFLQN
jgi:hypothetical protein